MNLKKWLPDLFERLLKVKWSFEVTLLFSVENTSFSVLFQNTCLSHWYSSAVASGSASLHCRHIAWPDQLLETVEPIWQVPAADAEDYSLQEEAYSMCDLQSAWDLRSWVCLSEICCVQKEVLTGNPLRNTKFDSRNGNNRAKRQADLLGLPKLRKHI